MKSKVIKIVAIALAAVVVVGLILYFFVFRNKNNSTAPGNDGTKTTLEVCYYNGGLRDIWLNTAIERFTEIYADYSFEEGKKGVFVDLNSSKDNRGNNFLVTAKTSTEDVFLLEDVDYYDYMAAGNMMDITDIVTKPAVDKVENGVPASTETGSIESKMRTTARDYYNVGTEEAPKYYALPFHASTMNINYNIDLFEQKGYYFAKGKTAEGMTDEELEEGLVDLFVSDGYDVSLRSAGPDNEEGTEDDGLPATYADLRALMKYMLANGTTPFIWTGRSNFYITKLANEAWANFEGAAQMQLNFKLGAGEEATNLVELDDNGNIQIDQGKIKTYSEIVDSDEAYKLHLQEGALHALELIRLIFENEENYAPGSVNPGFTHLDAQRNFIKYGYDSNYNDVGAAMLIDGTWWDSEGRTYFDSVGNNSYLNRRFGIMPIPKASVDQLGDPQTKLITCTSAIFINSNCTGASAEAAKAFVSFLHSDEALNIFTGETAIMREFNYELTNTTLAGMSYYGKQVYNMFQDEDVDVIDVRPLTDEAVNNNNLLNEQTWGFTKSDGTNNPAEVFYNTWRSGNMITAEAYFLEVYNYYASNWSTLYHASAA